MLFTTALLKIRSNEDVLRDMNSAVTLATLCFTPRPSEPGHVYGVSFENVFLFTLDTCNHE